MATGWSWVTEEPYLHYKHFISGVAPDLKLLIVSFSILCDAHCTHLREASQNIWSQGLSNNYPLLNLTRVNLHWGSVWSCRTALSHSPRRSPPSFCRTARPSRGGTGASAWAWIGPGLSLWRGLFYALSTRWKSPASTGVPNLKDCPEKVERAFWISSGI